LVGGLIAIIYKSEVNAITVFLGWRPLRVLGSASYGLYLLQGPLHAYLLMFVVDPYGRIFALPVIILVSIVVWHFVEEPCRKFIMRFRIKEEAPGVRNVTERWLRNRV
jgi:peptidoglycan/LPS O-acetylase OafA/YrhL